MSAQGKILVVDDNKEMLEIICQMCRSMKIADVEGVTHGAQALAFLAKNPDVQLVLCDWNMPEITGLDVLREIRSKGNLTPFVMITSRNDIDSVLSARKYGVDLYISKPFSTQELQEKVRWVLSPNHLSKAEFTDHAFA